MAKGARTQGPGGRGAPSQALSCSRGGGRGQGPGARTAWVPRASGLPHAAKASAAAGTRAGRAKRASRGGRLGVAATWPPASPGHSAPPQQGSWFVSSQPTLLPSLLQLLSIWAPVPPTHGGVDEGRECHPTCQQGQVTPEWLCPLGGGLGSPLVTQARRREAGPREHRLLPRGRPLRPWPILQLASFSSSIFNSPPACRFGLAAVADALPGRQNGFVSSLG